MNVMTTPVPKPLKLCPLSAANLPQDLDTSGSFSPTHPSVSASSSSSSKMPLFKRIWYFGKPTQSSDSPGEPFEGKEDEDSVSANSRNYVPSPLSSPRRFGQRLSTKISKSPLLSRVKRKLDEGKGSRASFSSSSSILPPSSALFLKSCGFGSFTSDEEYPNNLHDSGRIANRYSETKWDAWTTMGEDMTEDDDDDDEDEEDTETSNSYSSSSSMDDFLQLPIDNSYGKNKRGFW